jgi:hypothetical protein
MGQLADLFTNFLRIASACGQTPWLLVDDLRFPAGDSGTLTGSEIGARLWATPEGIALLNFASEDAEVQASFHGNWFPRRVTRHLLSHAVALAITAGRDPVDWTNEAEDALWAALRREDHIGKAVAVVEGIVTPDTGLALPSGLAVLPSNDYVIDTFLARGWITYRTHLPSRPHSLLYAQVSAPRRYFGGSATTAWARIALMRLRDAIWLATSAVRKLGHGVAWEDSPFPVDETTHFEPETGDEQRQSAIEINGYERQLAAIVRRLEVVSGNAETDPPLDDDTSDALRNIRDQADVALRSADARFATFLAFSAANGALRAAEDQEGSTGFVSCRFGLLCGRDDEEADDLDQQMRRLVHARRAVAHGLPPSAAILDRFIGIPEPTPANADDLPWYTDEQRQRTADARAKALELLRRLFVSYLTSTLRLADDKVVPQLTRTELVTLLQEAQRDVGHAREQLRTLNTI